MCHRYAVPDPFAADRGLRSQGSPHSRLLLLGCYAAEPSQLIVGFSSYSSFERPGNSEGRQPVHFLNVFEKTNGFW